MKIVFLTVFACFAMTAEPHPFLGLENIAAGIGEGLGKVVESGVALGLGTVANIGAGALGLGAGVVNGIAKGVENGLGLQGPAQRSASRNIQEGREQGAVQNDDEETGAYSEEYHKKSEKNHHDRARHHSTVTTITRVEDSDEHDVGSSEASEQSAHTAAASKAHASATAKNYGSHYEGDSEEDAEK